MPTTEERIAELETYLDYTLAAPHGAKFGPEVVIACELRALRLMLREEIREAAWTVAMPRTAAMSAEILGEEALASRKAPDA
jgi:hypothetical protein